MAEILGGRKPKQLENLGGDDPVLVRKHVNFSGNEDLSQKVGNMFVELKFATYTNMYI